MKRRAFGVLLVGVLAATAAFAGAAKAADPTKTYCINGQTVVLNLEGDGLLIDTIDASLAAGIHGAFTKEDPFFEGPPDDENETFVDQWYDEDDLVLIHIIEQGFVFS